MPSHRPFTAASPSLMASRDASRAKGWLDRLGTALVRGDEREYDHARRELKRLGLNVARQPAEREEQAAG